MFEIGGKAFNSLFEMLRASKGDEAIRQALILSILYLRCNKLLELIGARRRVLIPFNSLFEMHDV